MRIPKEFELPGTDAVMRREGNRLILDLVPDKPKKGTLAALAAALESMRDWEPVAEPFPDVDEGPNDTLIAAHALALGATLVTANAEFSHVPDLKTENWLQPS